MFNLADVDAEFCSRHFSALGSPKWIGVDSQVIMAFSGEPSPFNFSALLSCGGISERCDIQTRSLQGVCGLIT